MAKLVFYNAWFCPFAQRAWIGLLHRNLDFEYVEQDPYDKTGDWLKVNPRGLVPALIHNNRSIYESTVLLEYLDEAFPDHPGPAILPKDPYKRFLARVWSDFVSKKIVPSYYACLQKKDKEEREEHKTTILTNLKYLFSNMESSGPFFLGPDPCFVDFMLFPHAHRCYQILGAYREFEIPNEGAEYEKFWGWYNNMLKLPCVSKTLADKDKLIVSYKRYEDDSVVSEVATAIRKGTALP